MKERERRRRKQIVLSGLEAWAWHEPDGAAQKFVLYLVATAFHSTGHACAPHVARQESEVRRLCLLAVALVRMRSSSLVSS